MSLFDEGEEDLVFAGDIAEEEFVSKPAETTEETSTQKSLADYTQKQIFDHLLELFSEKTNPSLEFLDAAFLHVRITSPFFQAPNRQALLDRIEAHFDAYKQEQLKEIQKRAVSAPSNVPVDVGTSVATGTPGAKKHLGEDPVKKLQDLVMERLSGEDEAVPVNNLLQSLSQEYSIPKETYGKRWLRWLTMQDFLNVNTDENMVSLLPEYNTGAGKNLQFPIMPEPKKKKNKKKKAAPMHLDAGGPANDGGASRGDFNRRGTSPYRGGPPRGRRGRGFHPAGQMAQKSNTYPYTQLPYRNNTYPYSPRGSYGGGRPNRGGGMRGRGYRGRGRGGGWGRGRPPWQQRGRYQSY